MDQSLAGKLVRILSRTMVLELHVARLQGLLEGDTPEDRFQSVADFAAVGPRFWTVLSIYCQPSLTHTVGRTLALALAHGIPSIASSVKGLHTLIDHGRTGSIVPAGDPEALALAINQFLDHDDLAMRIGLEGQAATRALFDLEAEADCLTSLYRSQIDKSL